MPEDLLREGGRHHISSAIEDQQMIPPNFPSAKSRDTMMLLVFLSPFIASVKVVAKRLRRDTRPRNNQDSSYSSY